MGTCTAKQCKLTAKQRRTACTLPEKSINKDALPSQKEFQIDIDQNSSYSVHFQEVSETQKNNFSLSMNKKHDSKNSKNKQSAKQGYVSCFHNPETAQDPIQQIVLLEEACITLKHKMEQEKIKIQKKMQEYLKKYGQSQVCQNSNNYLTSRQQSSTHISIDQNQSSIQNIQKSNEIHCYNTIIKLADFIQEKSQKLWEDPNDVEIHDALSSLFWASKMLQLECLQEFEMEVTKNMNVYCDESAGREAQKKCQFNSLNQQQNKKTSYKS
ncbi:hypothetical protein ABPG72_022744 [Tetrahymena utriculariae]